MLNITLWFTNLGVPEELLLILAFVPIIITITSISRYITGIKTFGIYPPMVLAISYYYLGIARGLLLTAFVIISAIVVRAVLKKTGLHYLSRLGAIYSGIVFFLLVFILIDAQIFAGGASMMNYATLTPLAVVFVVSITDRFVSNFIKKDLIVAVRLTLETVIIALIGWGLLAWNVTHDIILNNLWIPLVALVLNIIIGKYTGLRFIEFIRFSQVIENVEDTRNNKKK